MADAKGRPWCEFSGRQIHAVSMFVQAWNQDHPGQAIPIGRIVKVRVIRRADDKAEFEIQYREEAAE